MYESTVQFNATVDKTKLAAAKSESKAPETQKI